MRERLLQLQIDGFDDVTVPTRASATRSGAHYCVARDRKNTRLYITSEYIHLFDEFGGVVRLAYSTNTGALAILPESYGVGSPRKVAKTNSARAITLSQFHDAMVARFGRGSVRVRLEHATFGDMPAIVARPVEG